MSTGMKHGLERGPIASSADRLFVADWKDSLLKVYVEDLDSWAVVAKLPARISRLVGRSGELFGLSGKVKIDPYHHRVISDAPAEVWRLKLPPTNLPPMKTATMPKSSSSSSSLSSSSSSSSSSLSSSWSDNDDDGDGDDGDDDDGGDPLLAADCHWECLWWDPKQMVKTGGLAWAPCIAHCTLFED
jgi:hypothetical protein